MKRICVLGAGVLGLAFAYHLEQLSNQFTAVIFEKDNQVGGRTRSITNHECIIDIGANYLTFDMLKRPEETEQFFRQYLSNGFLEIHRSLYLYNDKLGLCIGDYQSKKLSYRNGISYLAKHLKEKLKSTELRLNTYIKGMSYVNGKWNITVDDGSHIEFYAIVIAVPPISVAEYLTTCVSK
jgi:protoporphyrinogen oxidase